MCRRSSAEWSPSATRKKWSFATSLVSRGPTGRALAYRPLDWNGLHPKAREFLFTEGTLQQLDEDHALYAQALIAGGDLTPWHSRPLWKAKAQKTGKNPVTHLDAKQKAVWRMANTARETVAGANGQQMLKTLKNKELRFPNQADFERYIAALIDDQDSVH